MKNQFRWLLVLALLAVPVLTVAARTPREPRNIRNCDPDTIHSLRDLLWFTSQCNRGSTATPSSGDLVEPTETRAPTATTFWRCMGGCACLGYPCPEDYTTTPGLPTMTPYGWWPSRTPTPTPIGWTASPTLTWTPAPTLTHTPIPTSTSPFVACTSVPPYPGASTYIFNCTVTPVGWTASPTITPIETYCHRGGCFGIYATDTPAGWTASPTMTWTPWPTSTSTPVGWTASPTMTGTPTRTRGPTRTPTLTRTPVPTRTNTPGPYIPPEDRPTATPYNTYP